MRPLHIMAATAAAKVETIAIVIGGLVLTIIAGVKLGPLAASGMALGAALLLAFRSNAAKAGLRAAYYARLERQIIKRRRQPDDPGGANISRLLDRGPFAPRSRAQNGLGAAGLDPDHDPDAGGGFRVAGISFDRDASETSKRTKFENCRVEPNRRVEPLPLAVRLRDEAGPRLPQMVAQNRARLYLGNRLPDGQGDYPLGNSRHLPDDADPRCKGRG